MTPPANCLRDVRTDADLGRDGFAVVDLLDPGDVGRLRSLFERYAHVHQGPFSASLLLADPQVRSEVHHAVYEAMADAVDALLAGYRAVFCGFAAKAPCAHGGEMPLHQDISFSRPQGRPSLGIWAPLVSVDATNGCLVLVPGSHRFNNLPRAPGSPAAAAVDLHAFRASGLLQELPLHPGQAVVMHQGLLHASSGNRSEGVRAAATVVAVPCEEPAHYYHRIQGGHFDAPPVLEGFAVPDDFFLHHQLGSRPARGTSLGTRAEAVEFINPQRMLGHPLAAGNDQ